MLIDFPESASITLLYKTILLWGFDQYLKEKSSCINFYYNSFAYLVAPFERIMIDMFDFIVPIDELKKTMSFYMFFPHLNFFVGQGRKWS